MSHGHSSDFDQSELKENEQTAAGSRRNFLKLGLFGATSMGLQPMLGNSAEAQQETYEAGKAGKKAYDFTKQSSALQADKTIHSACQFCNANCRLTVSLKSGRVIDISGETEDPVQAGELCVKADMMSELVYNAKRLKMPMQRIKGAKGSGQSQFKEISWDSALTLIAKKFLALRDAGEAHTIVNRTTGRMLRGAGSVIERVMRLLGSPNHTDVGPVCNDAGGNALAWTFGTGNFTNGYGVDKNTGKEDLGSAKFLFFLGTNQAETHPVTFAHMLRCREKTGAKLVVVDPRLTPTGAQADRWLAIRPHTDLALIMGMIGEILRQDLYDKAFIKKWTVGFEVLKKEYSDKGYNAEWAATRCDLDAKVITKLAQDFAKTSPAAIFCNAGISHQMNAFATYRALAILSAITGNVGIAGGGCNFMHNTWPGGLNLAPTTVPFPKITKDSLPVGPDQLCDALIHGKPYKIKAMVTEGNPLIASANTNRVKEAMKSLEFYVYTGLFMEEAADYADLVLPVTSGLETEGVYMRRDDRAIRWQEAAVNPVGQSKTDIEIWVGLAQKLAELDKKTDWAKAVPAKLANYEVLWQEFIDNTPGTAGLTKSRLESNPEPMRFPCPDVKHPGVSTMYLDHPSWYQAMKSLNPKWKNQRFATPSGKVEIYTEEMQKKLATAGHTAIPHFFTHPEVQAPIETIDFSKDYVKSPINGAALTRKASIGRKINPADFKDFPLMGMVGRASVVHFAGVTQWTYSGKTKHGIRHIQVHPDTAKEVGLKNGDECKVISKTGAIKGTVLCWEGIRKDTIFVPNSFGPSQVLGKELGAPVYEAANTLTNDQHFDNLSGQQAYKCFACKIEKI